MRGRDNHSLQTERKKMGRRPGAGPTGCVFFSCDHAFAGRISTVALTAIEPTVSAQSRSPNALLFRGFGCMQPRAHKTPRQLAPGFQLSVGQTRLQELLEMGLQPDPVLQLLHPLRSVLARGVWLDSAAKSSGAPSRVEASGGATFPRRILRPVVVEHL